MFCLCPLLQHEPLPCAQKEAAEKGPHSFCHSERSEESLFLFMELNRREIPRFARNDKINYFFRRSLQPAGFSGSKGDCFPLNPDSLNPSGCARSFQPAGAEPLLQSRGCKNKSVREVLPWKRRLSDFSCLAGCREWGSAFSPSEQQPAWVWADM